MMRFAVAGAVRGFAPGRLIARACLWAGIGLLLPALAGAGDISALYVLGDSFSDQGNAFALTGGYPPAPYAHDASNGPVAAQQLASQLGLPLVASQLGGTNYAVIGATTAVVPNPFPFPPGGLTDNVTASTNPFVPNIGTLFGHSVVQQAADIAGGAGSLSASSLFLIFAGANDGLLMLFGNGQTPLDAAVNIASAIDTLYADGARQFLVPNMPDLALLPFSAGLPVAQQLLIHNLSLVFNANLTAQLSLLSATRPGIQLTSFDSFGFFNNIVANPSALFTNTLTPCFSGSLSNPVGTVCANPDSALWWDTVHPTAAAHQLLGNALAAAVAPVPEPATMTLVALGLGACVIGRQRGRRKR